MGEPADSVVTDSSLVSNASQNPLYEKQWYLGKEDAEYLWKLPLINKKRPIIGILDTGVDITHPDLAENIWTNEKEADGEEGYDDDGDGFADDIHGWDFVNNTGKMRDNNSHGTHVAGIAAAADNGVGIIGANPKAIILPVTVFQSDGTGDVATIAKGIDYAISKGATVLNMSFGTGASSLVLRQALEHAYQNAVLVAAAGNDGLPIYQSCGFPYETMYPAAYSFVLGVQATTQSGVLAGFSNVDCDGPIYSAEKDAINPDGYNYELSAPGVGILSTVPNGGYKEYNGTSMAAPLVAGTISALQMVKEYDSQEILWGDLLHSSTVGKAFDIKDRPAELDLLGMQVNVRKDLTADSAYASMDNEIDAGETVNFYPVLRTTFGDANNIKLKLEMGDEYEDASVVEFVTPEADFGYHLSAYGKNASKNPVTIKVSSTVADARHIKLKLIATADNTDQSFEFPFTIVATNMRKIGGLIEKDTTLTADRTWYVTENVGILKGVTLTIEPGTRVEFAEGMGISSAGKLIAKGTPEKPIVFTRHVGEDYWKGVTTHISETGNPRDTLYYCRLEYCTPGELYSYKPYMKDCIIPQFRNHR